VRAELAARLLDARARTLALAGGLDTGERRLGPRLAIVNPPLWELGHVGWFQEKWILRGLAGAPPLRAEADSLYDSSAVHHDVRWDLPLPSWDETLAELARILERVLERLERVDPTPEELYFHRLVLYHEDMHGEALTYTRQTHGWECPVGADVESSSGPLAGEVEVPGGTFRLGAEPDEEFVFDNEKWAHEVELEPFRMARAPVTQAEFAAFVDERGYERPELWSRAGRRWLERTGARCPVYWRRDGSGWLRRHYERWHALEPHRPVVHVNAFEAEAWCRWAGRRLPSEAEWERAATWDASGAKRAAPWGSAAPAPERAQLDGWERSHRDVADLAAGESALGLRQLWGGVWEWTGDAFGPFPGFSPDPYEDYSQPWFGDHATIRGGALATRARLMRNTLRSWTMPHRGDLFTGFRTVSARA